MTSSYRTSIKSYKCKNQKAIISDTNGKLLPQPQNAESKAFLSETVDGTRTVRSFSRDGSLFEVEIR